VVDSPLALREFHVDHGIRRQRETRVDPDSTFVVIHTSGTTGRPKPVELTYGNFHASALANAANLGVEPDDRWLCCMPLFHVGGLSILTRSVINQTEAVIHDGFDTERVQRALADEQITLVSLVATQLRRLLDAGVTAPHLRAALIGGGPVPSDVLERAPFPVIPTYGMTETCSQVWTGKPLPGAEIANGPDGELLVRGPMVAPKSIAGDGWLHTGDRGHIDEQGNLTVEGRIADTIVTGGENVAAAEVEEALIAHPAIEDAAVVGRPDPEWGQAVVAFVVAAGDASDLDAHLRGRLPGYKVPKRIEYVAEIPRNAAGKIQRGRLPE
jgi:O-succinylbenzoic acid--CoA ligase